MTIPNVDNETLNALTPNLDIGDVADPALRLASFNYIYEKLQGIVSELNSLPTANLQNLSVTTAKIADLAVTAAKLADGAVITAKLGDLAVTLAKLAANSVDSSKIIDLAVVTSKLNDLAVTTAKLGGLSVTAAKIAEGTITETKYGDGTVSTRAIADFAVTQPKIGNGAVGPAQLQTGLAVSADVNAQFAKRGIDVTSAPYFAKGDGITNDTAAIQAALNVGSIIIPAGTYMIDAVTKLTVPSNRSIYFHQGAVLQCITNNQSTYRIMFINNAENVTIYNPTIIGDRSTHTGVGGEDGHGITVAGTSNNIKIYNPHVSNCWGDGFVIYGGTNVYVENLYSDNNRRQGLTITNGENITFMNPTCINSNGTAPQAGIDIEPNFTTDEIKNVNLINPRTGNNEGAGITIGLQSFVDSTHEVTINISNHVDNGSYYGFIVNRLPQGSTGVLSGAINIDNPVYYNNETNGIAIINYAANNTPSIHITNYTVINCNASSQSSPRYGSAVVILRESAATETTSQGNVYLTNGDLRDRRAVPKMVNGIYAIDDKSGICENVFISNLNKISGVSSVREMININISGIVVTDENFVTQYSPGASVTLLSRVYSRLTSLGASAKVVFTLDTSAVIIDSPSTFINRAGVGLRIVPSSTMTIRPTSTVNGKYIETTDIGASITIRKISSTQWMVENIVGTWTVEP